MTVELRVFLTCTAHGKPVWRVGVDERTAGLPDRDVSNPPPVRELGPYEVGPEGYATVEEAVAGDVSLDEPETWFPNPDWPELYARHGIHPGDLDVPVRLTCGCTALWHEADLLHTGAYCWCPRCGDAFVAVILGRW